jgi:hypothetical protein
MILVLLPAMFSLTFFFFFYFILFGNGFSWYSSIIN